MWDFEISYAERYSKDKQLSSIERFWETKGGWNLKFMFRFMETEI
jgi:hypothetical protein